MPLATDVLFERTDDGLYIPIISVSGLACRYPVCCLSAIVMSALDTRAYLARHHWYLSPLPLTGATAEAITPVPPSGNEGEA